MKGQTSQEMMFRAWLEETLPDPQDRDTMQQLFGMNRLAWRIYAATKHKQQFIDAFNTHINVYERVKEAVKSVPALRFNLSITEGWRQYYAAIMSALRKYDLRHITQDHIIRTNQDSTSLAGWGRFNFNTAFDMWEFLTAVELKGMGEKSLSDPKQWIESA